jgi:multiple sugar transport system ATP-binding protein
VLIGIRAENIEAVTEPARESLPARTEVVEPLGSHLLVTAMLGDQLIKLLTRTDFPAQPQQPIYLRPEADKLRWYDMETKQELAA